jgi:hypothetical protein
VDSGDLPAGLQPDLPTGRSTVYPAAAGDSSESKWRWARVNVITALGQMRAPAAADLMGKLLDDPAVATNAAIALYRITGKKVVQFPAGYNAD